MKNVKAWHPDRSLYIILATLVFLGILPMPAIYYPIMYVIVSLFSIYVTYMNIMKKSDKMIIVIFLAIAIIFNPIIPLALTRESAIIIYLLTGLAFLRFSKMHKDIKGKK